MEDNNRDKVPDRSEQKSSCPTPTGICCCSGGRFSWQWLLLPLLVIFTVIFLKDHFTGREPGTPSVVWNDDYAEALRLAREHNKPLLLAFHATWCGPCQEMKRTTYHDPEVIQAAAQFVTLMIDFDKQTDLVQRFKIEAIPAFVILAPDEKTVTRFEGLQPPEDFLARLGQGLESFKKL